MFYQVRYDKFASFLKNPAPFPLHLHETIELSYATNLPFHMQIEEREYEISPGSMAVVFPNVVHSYTGPNDDQQHLIKISIVNCNPSLLPQLRPILLTMHPLTPVIASEEVHEDIRYLMGTIQRSGPDADINLMGNIVSIILYRALPFLHLAEYQQPLGELSSDIIGYISNHYREDLTLDHVATALGTTRYTISRVLSNTIHHSFSDYINRLRMIEARYLLAGTDLEILQIALECGYNNHQTFNRVFREQNGCTPREYRQTSRIRSEG